MKNPTLEEQIVTLKRENEKASLSLREILSILSGKGKSVILLFLSLPFCLPLQIPGLSIPIGILIAFIGLRMAFGKHIWLPKGFLEKKIKQRTLQKITDKTLRLVKRVKRWVHPRLSGLCYYPAVYIVNGLLIFILGLCLALPLPVPFSNMSVAWSIFFVELGLLENDGLFILMGYFFSLVVFAFLVAMALSIKLIF